MEYQERERLTRRILCGFFFDEVVFSEDHRQTVKFYDPNQSQLAEADFIYYKQLEELERDGVYSLEESVNILIDSGRWSDEQDAKLSGMQTQRDHYRSQLLSCGFEKGKERKLTEAIEELSSKINQLLHKKYQLRDTTREYMADRSRRNFLLKFICPDLETNVNSFMSERLLVYYFEGNDVSDKQIRELARSQPWRLYWNSSKKVSSPLFHHPLCELTQLQTLLVHWSGIYDYAFENPERPSEDTIDNDEKFDAWLKEQDRKAKQESSKHKLPKGNMNTGQETFIVADKEGAREVYDLNDPNARHTIRQRQAAIKKHGEVREADLPDVKRQLQMERNKMAMQKGQQR